MGIASYHEDILEAKGEPLRSSLRQQTKETEVVKAEMPYYEFEGKPFTQDVVETILMQWAWKERRMLGEKEKWLTIEKWAEYLRAYHEKNGGNPPEGDLVNIVSKALISLYNKGHARHFSRDNSSGKWKVFHTQLQRG